MQLAQSLPPDQLAGFLGEIESIRVTALARIQPATDIDETIDAKEAARQLGISRATFYRTNKRKRYPFCSTEGSKITASLAALKRYQEQKRK